MVNKELWVSAFTLSGTIIGAGILGLPFVFAKAGFIVGIFWLLIIGAIMTFINLCVGEICLRTKGQRHLVGYAEKYLGRKGKAIMFFAIIFGIYSALIAYLIGEGRSLSEIFPGNINPIFFGFLFWLIMNFFIIDGIRSLRKIETIVVLLITTMIICLLFWSVPQIQIANLLTLNSGKFFAPVGVILFSLLGFTSIPELRRSLKGNEKFLKKAIILGGLIPIFLYIIFTLVFVGVLGREILEVATLSLGPFVVVIGIFTMLGAYFVLSFVLRHIFVYDLNVSRKKSFIFYSLIPFAIYLLIEGFSLLGFSSIIGIGGIVSGGISGIIILLINYQAKKFTQNKKCEINMPINKTGIIILSIIFLTGMVLKLFEIFF